MTNDHAARRLDPFAGLDALVRALGADGYRVVGPVLRDGVIAYDDVTGGDDLPAGCAVNQQAGRWRLAQGTGRSRFGWTPGADSWKQFVHPARQEVVRVRRHDGTWAVTHSAPADRPMAFIGARDCELRALDILDRVLLDPDHPDPRYAQRRRDIFVVAVTCGVPSDTCWCTTMGGGPEPERGFDIRLTELDDDDGHRLLAVAGSERGAALLDRLPVTDDPAAAGPTDTAAARRVVEHARERLPVRFPGEALPALLAGTEHHPRWDQVANRCLSCGNCTSVCPTCFCTSFADSTGLGGAIGQDETVRHQHWVSCFELDHSNLGGRPVRDTTAARYRQWLTHKLETWPDQFDTAGCVGCGRCTTWCPAGIDLVEETESILASTGDRVTT